MKKYLSRNVAALGTALFVLLPFPGVIQAAPRLIGISGFSDGPGLYEINPTNAVTTLLFTPSPVSDTPTLGFSPTNGMLYFFGGGYAYRAADPVTGLNDPTKGGYQDTHYMAKIDLVTSNETGIFNADPCPNPDNPANDIGSDGIFLRCYGLPAPFPTFVLPQYRRDSTMTDPTNRLDGPNEYHYAMGAAWSPSENLFYVTDNSSKIFKLTTAGDSTVTTLTSGNPRGTAFLTVNGATNLWVGEKTAGGLQGTITEIDTVAETIVGDLLLNIPPTSTNTESFGGVMGLAQHPDTGVIYAMRAPLSGAGDATGRVRELITINMATGDTTLVGVTPVEINSIVFYTTTTTTPAQIQSVARSGNDITLAWTGGVPPYNIDSRASLSAGLWSTVVSNILTLSATVTNGVSGPAGFFRVSGH